MTELKIIPFSVLILKERPVAAVVVVASHETSEIYSASFSAPIEEKAFAHVPHSGSHLKNYALYYWK